MNMSQNIKLLSLLLAVLLGMSQIATAGSPYMDIPEYQRLSREAWQHYWNSLSPRQQYLVVKIGEVEANFYKKNGHHIPVSQRSVFEVMRVIGARESEADFIANRMHVYLKLDDTLRKADDFTRDVLKDPRIWGR